MKKTIACVLASMLLFTVTPAIIFAIGDNDISTYSCTVHDFDEVAGSERVQCDEGKCGFLWLKPKTENTYLQMKCTKCGATTVAFHKTGCCD